MNVTKTVSTGLVALALSVSLGASAAMIKGTHNSVRVDLSDLDLSSVQGERIMQNRLRRAAKQVCGPVHLKEAGSLQRAQENRVCFEEAFSNALEDVAARYMTAAR